MNMNNFNRMMRANERKVDKLYHNRLTNDGWATGDNFYCTKVYSRGAEPTVIVSTYIRNGKIVHKIEPYWR